MNGVITCHQKIIEFLKNHEGESFRKEQIAWNCPGNSVGTVGKALSDLGAKNYVAQAKGFYSITGMGKELPPNFDSTYYARSVINGGDKASRDFWVQLIDWDYARNNFYCRQVLEDPELFKRDWEAVKKHLTIFVLLYLAASGVSIPREQHLELEPDDNMREVIEAIVKYINKQI